jgi:hypothetical protein
MLGGRADIYLTIPAYTRERAAAMFLGSIVREFYYKLYGENRTMIRPNKKTNLVSVTARLSISAASAFF